MSLYKYLNNCKHLKYFNNIHIIYQPRTNDVQRINCLNNQVKQTSINILSHTTQYTYYCFILITLKIKEIY